MAYAWFGAIGCTFFRSQIYPEPKIKPPLTQHEHFDKLLHMKPDKKTCLYCGIQIEGKKKYCSDAHRMAFNRNPNKVEQETEHLPEQKQSEHEQPNPNTFRDGLTKTDKSFYNRAMRDFGEPYYRFGPEVQNKECWQCKVKFKTSLSLNRYCSYEHYKEAIGK